MAEITPKLQVSSADGDDLGTDGHTAFAEIVRFYGNVDDGNSRPNTPRVLHVHEGGADTVQDAIDDIVARDAVEGVRARNDPFVIKVGRGNFARFKLDDVSGVHVVGAGKGLTHFATSPSAQGSDGDFWPSSINFSNSRWCGLHGFTTNFTDDGTQNAAQQAAIQRAGNTGTYSTYDGLIECYMTDLEIRIGELDTGRTANANFVLGIGYLPGNTDSTTNFACTVRNVDIISSSCGITSSDGEWHFHDCNVWYGASANTDTPLNIGFNWARGGRSYWWGGKITTGYNALNPVSDAAVYGIRCIDANAGGRFFIHDAVIFARSNKATSPPTTRAIYMNGSLSDPWIRIEAGCYLQAETQASTDNPAIETDWTLGTPGPTTTGNRLEVREGNRIAGMLGNILGPAGRKTITNDYDFASHQIEGDNYVDTTSNSVTLTMNSHAAVDNTKGRIKHVAGSNTCTIAVASGDYLDGTLNGTLVVPAGGSVLMTQREIAGGLQYWETSEKNWTTRVEQVPFGMTGEVIDGQLYPRHIIQVGANETVTLDSMTARIESGTSVDITIELDGVDVTDLTGVTVTTTQTTTNVDPDEAITDGQTLQITSVTNATGTPVALSGAYRLTRTSVTKGA